MFRYVSAQNLLTVPPCRNVPDNNTDAEEVSQLQDGQPLDEAALIEERRKKREAIKAKHRGQATPMLVQALALDNKSAPPTPRSPAVEDGTQGHSKVRRSYGERINNV